MCTYTAYILRWFQILREEERQFVRLTLDCIQMCTLPPHRPGPHNLTIGDINLIPASRRVYDLARTPVEKTLDYVIPKVKQNVRPIFFHFR